MARTNETVISKEFNQFLDSAITVSLRNLLGESSMKALLFHLRLSEVSKDPELFHERLRSLLKEPSKVVELMIVKEVYTRLNLGFDDKEPFDFVSLTAAAKAAFLDQQHRGAR